MSIRDGPATSRILTLEELALETDTDVDHIAARISGEAGSGDLS